MKARIVRIGNSRGVRLPKPLIEEARLSEEVEILARDGAIVDLVGVAAASRLGCSGAARTRARWRSAH